MADGDHNKWHIVVNAITMYNTMRLQCQVGGMSHYLSLNSKLLGYWVRIQCMFRQWTASQTMDEHISVAVKQQLINHTAFLLINTAAAINLIVKKFSPINIMLTFNLPIFFSHW